MLYDDLINNGQLKSSLRPLRRNERKIWILSLVLERFVFVSVVQGHLVKLKVIVYLICIVHEFPRYEAT